MQQFGLNLMGRSEDPFLLAGESGYDERDVLPAARREGDEVALSVAATRSWACTSGAGDYAGAVARRADEAIEHVDGMAGTAFMQLVYLIGALSRIQAAPKDRSTGSPCAGHWRCTASGRRAHRPTTRHRMP